MHHTVLATKVLQTWFLWGNNGICTVTLQIHWSWVCKMRIQFEWINNVLIISQVMFQSRNMLNNKSVIKLFCNFLLSYLFLNAYILDVPWEDFAMWNWRRKWTLKSIYISLFKRFFQLNYFEGFSIPKHFNYQSTLNIKKTFFSQVYYLNQIGRDSSLPT